MGIVNRTAKKADKAVAADKALGFFNYTVLNKHGEEAIRSKKGFAIFDNQYTSSQEKQLIDLATKNGGEITLNCTVVIRLNQQKEMPETDLSLFV